VPTNNYVVFCPTVVIGRSTGRYKHKLLRRKFTLLETDYLTSQKGKNYLLLKKKRLCRFRGEKIVDRLKYSTYPTNLV